MAAEEPTYAAALTELESILLGLESTSVDVDHLAAQVSRAAALIAFCRDRLTVVEREVAVVVNELDASGRARPTEDIGDGQPSDAVGDAS